MLRLLTDIPDYDEELERLANNESFDVIAALKRFLDNLFNIHLDAQMLEVFKYLAYAVIIVVVLWFVYKEFSLNGLTIESRDVDIVPKGGLQGTAADADIRGHKFDRELNEALLNEDYAEAVRLRYLYTLQMLNDISSIEWKEWKTPLMYVNEMDEDAELLKELTMMFLFIKYGHYPARKETYEQATQWANTLVINKKGGAE